MADELMQGDSQVRNVFCTGQETWNTYIPRQAFKSVMI